MYLSTVAIAALSVSAVSGIVVPRKGKHVYNCDASAYDSEHYLDSIDEWLEEESKIDLAKRDTIEVPVLMHVIASGEGEENGQVPENKLQNQISVMNNAYAPHGIHFMPAGVNYVYNTSWAMGGGQRDMRHQLREGDFKTLNLYFLQSVGPPEEGIFGRCYFPHELPPGRPDKPYMMDGCEIKSSTVPGGSEELANLGGTAIHEVGHWFGLYHTFEGNSCTGDGDGVPDTPPQAEATQLDDGCGVRDSCPGVPGNDAVSNFMDYSADMCYTQFTEGQELRMRNFYAKYRVTESPVYRPVLNN